PKIYTHAYYQRLREVEDRHWWSRGMRTIARALLEPFLPPGQPWDILDAGCGTGVTLDWLGRLGISGRAVGIDISPHALTFCRSRNQTDLSLASLLDLPFPDGSFDLITCLDVLQHLPLPDGDLRGLQECHRVLKPGGILFVRSNARRLGDGE